MNTLYDFENLLSSDSQNQDEGNQMPSEVNEAFVALQEEIFVAIQEFLNKTYDFELNVIGSKKITVEQTIAVSSYLKKTIKEKLNCIPWTLIQSQQMNTLSCLLIIMKSSFQMK